MTRSSLFNRQILPLWLGGLYVLISIGWTAAATAHGVPADEVQRLVDGGPLAYLRSGAVHMMTPSSD